jgi:hypothetical protein
MALKTPTKALPGKQIKLHRVNYTPEERKISRMRTLQKGAIAACDIDLAEHYDGVISKLHQEVFDTSWFKLKSDFGDSVRSLLALYEHNMQQINSKESSKMLEFKRKINTDFIKLQSRHRQTLADLQTDFAALRMKESQRIVTESDELIKQSKYASAVQNYQHARLLQELSEITCKAEIERRHERINIEMKQQFGRIMAEQQKELENLVDRLNRGIATIKTSADNDRSLEFEMKDVKFIGELNKFTKELVALCAQSVKVEPFQRELEDLLVQIIEVAGLTVPKKLKKNVKTASKQSVKSPRSTENKQ